MCIFVGPYIIKKRQNIVTEPRGSLLGEEKKKKSGLQIQTHHRL